MEKIAERLIKPYNILHLRHDREKHNFSKKKQRKLGEREEASLRKLITPLIICVSTSKERNKGVAGKQTVRSVAPAFLLQETQSL